MIAHCSGDMLGGLDQITAQTSQRLAGPLAGLGVAVSPFVMYDCIDMLGQVQAGLLEPQPLLAEQRFQARDGGYCFFKCSFRVMLAGPDGGGVEGEEKGLDGCDRHKVGCDWDPIRSPFGARTQPPHASPRNSEYH